MQFPILKNFFIKTILISFSLAVFAFSLPSQAYDFNKESGLDRSAGPSFNIESPTTIPSIIGYIVMLVLSLLGVIFFAYIIYGGIVWMTADGNDVKIKRANDIVMNSLYGLIITLSTFAISWLVVDKLVK